MCSLTTGFRSMVTVRMGSQTFVTYRLDTHLTEGTRREPRGINRVLSVPKVWGSLIQPLGYEIGLETQGKQEL